MVLLAVTADTWIVTGLGFGIVLVLLFCLVFILQLFGWIMQKATAPKAPKAEKPVEQPAGQKKEDLPVVPAPQPVAGDDDMAAVAMALFLAHKDGKHDIPTAMIQPQVRDTAWNVKSYGLNNVGF